MVSGRRIMCVYGSVTGKAQSIAEQIVQTAETKGTKVRIDRNIFKAMAVLRVDNVTF